MYSNEIVCDILDYIELNINNKITINDISKKLNYDRYYLMKLFKKEIKLSIIDYINSIRIYNSFDYIKNNYSFFKVACSNGFYSLEYFSEIFKKILGVSPSIYKKFYYNRYIPSKSNYKLITDNIIKLNMLINKVNQYKLKTKPQFAPVKKLSIFK